MISFDPPIEIGVDYEDLSYVLYITEVDYSPATPSSSMYWNDDEGDEASPAEGYIELDGEVNDIVDITSSDMNNIMMMTNDNAAFFDLVVNENISNIEEKLLEKIYSQEMMECRIGRSEKYVQR